MSMDSLEKLKQQAQAFRDDAVAVPSALRGRRLDGIPDPLDRRGGDWLRANGLAPAVTPEELRARHARGEEADVAAAAEAAAWAACDLVLRAQPVGASELFDESILTHARAANDARRAAAASARNQLGLQGVCGEHLALPPKASIPLVHEMVFARHVGSSAAARRREPPAASFGKEHQWPTMPTASAPPPFDATLAVVVVAYHGDATGCGLEWLQELPPRVTAHLMCTGGARVSWLPRQQQTLVPPLEPVGVDEAGVKAGGGTGAATAPPEAAPGRRVRGEEQVTFATVGMRVQDKRALRRPAEGSGKAVQGRGSQGEVKPPVAAEGRAGAGAAAASRAQEPSSSEAAAAHTAPPIASPMSRPSTAHAFLEFLACAAENAELIDLLEDPIERERRVLVVASDRDQEQDDSVQATMLAMLRKEAQRVMDLFKKWDTDHSGTVDRYEFRRALRALKIPGSEEEHGLLFDNWDADGGGSIEYGELLKAMHAGRRYDSLRKRRADPPLPPVIIFTDADPFAHNPSFLQDAQLLLRAAAAGRATPRFVPLGKWKCGERLVHCDPSGAPHSRSLLPIAEVWRDAFGPHRPLPLFLAHVPGAGAFALSKAAALSPWCKSGRGVRAIPHAKAQPPTSPPVDMNHVERCEAEVRTAAHALQHAREGPLRGERSVPSARELEELRGRQDRADMALRLARVRHDKAQLQAAAAAEEVAVEAVEVAVEAGAEAPGQTGQGAYRQQGRPRQGWQPRLVPCQAAHQALRV